MRKIELIECDGPELLFFRIDDKEIGFLRCISIDETNSLVFDPRKAYAGFDGFNIETSSLIDGKYAEEIQSLNLTTEEIALMTEQIKKHMKNAKGAGR